MTAATAPHRPAGQADAANEPESRVRFRRVAVLGGVALLGIAAGLLRRPDSLTHPQLFAEDGSIFFDGALTQSLPSALVTSYAGYLHAVPRILASLASLLPLDWTPAVYTVMAGVLSVVGMMPALSARLAWLVPSTVGRCALFLALVLLPGVEDVHGVIANLQWWFGITLALLALSGDPKTLLGRVLEPIALVLIGLSGPFSILSAPMFWLRLWRTRSRPALLAAAIVTGCALIQAFVLLVSHFQSGHPGGVGADDLARAWVLRYGGTAVFGQATLRTLYLAGLLHGAFWVVSCGFLILVAIAASRLPQAAWSILALGVVGGVVSASIRLGHDVLALGDPINGGRYYVIPLAMLAIALIAVLSRGAVRHPTVPAWAMVVAGVPAGLMLLGAALDNQLPARPDIHWAASVQCIESHRTCTVPLDPPGWQVTIPPR